LGKNYWKTGGADLKYKLYVKTEDWRKTRAEQYDNELVSHRTQPDIYIWYFLLATNGGRKDSLEQDSRLHHNNCFTLNIHLHPYL